MVSIFSEVFALGQTGGGAFQVAVPGGQDGPELLQYDFVWENFACFFWGDLC